MISSKKMSRSIFSAFQFLVIAVIFFLATVQANAATITVPAGGSLQNAIIAAQPGDTIILQAGVTYSGVFVLPNKSGSNYITIQSSRSGELPEGVRVGPAQSALFAKLVSVHQADPVIRTAAGSHHYRFIGLEVSTPSPSTFVYDLIRIGSSQQTAAEVPHNIVIDRSYIHGFPTQDVQRGISLNGAEITVMNSHISEIHGRGYDTQALCGWNGPGPFRIINNYLAAAGENVMFGGALPSIANLVPSNIEIRRNHLFKPLSWKVGHSTYAGIHWSIKNLLEFKNARNVIIDGNVLENCWGDAQIGYAVLFTVRTEGGRAPWATLENISFTNNAVRNSEQGVQMLGTDYPYSSLRGNGVLIANNLFTGIANRFLTISGFYNVTLDHNTHFQGGNVVVFHDESSIGFTYTNNITKRSGYGFFGDSLGEGNIGLANYTPSVVFQKNLIAGAWPSLYPPNNFYPSSITGVLDSSYRVIASAYQSAGTDGKPLGCDIDALRAARLNSTAAPTPAATPLPDGTKATTIIDAQGGVWTFGPQRETLRNGIHIKWGYGFIYKWLGQVVYTLGTDNAWYKWTGTLWQFIGAEPGAATPLPDGTKATTIIDAQGGVWTFGPQRETLRNGIHIRWGYGYIYKWLGQVVYVLGTDNAWYKWTGTQWEFIGAEPGG